jgi:hypothetical protein
VRGEEIGSGEEDGGEGEGRAHYRSTLTCPLVLEGSLKDIVVVVVCEIDVVSGLGGVCSVWTRVG